MAPAVDRSRLTAGRTIAGAAAFCLAAASASGPAASPQPPAARIEVDAGRAAGRLSPLLYGQFIEFMFEGIKRGLHAELIRDRSFEEEPNAIGLSRYWERY